MGLDGETGYDPVFSQDMPLPKEKGKVHVEGHRCPYCHDQVVKGEGEAQLCDQCFAVSHRDCWTEHDGCGACGAGAQVCGVCGGKFNKDEAITTVISCMSCPQEFHLNCADQHECEQEEEERLAKSKKSCSACYSQLRFSSSACKNCSEQFCKDCFYEHACEQVVEAKLKPGHCPVCRRHMLVSVDCPRCERAHHDGCLSGHNCVLKKKRVAQRERGEIASMPSDLTLPSGDDLDGELAAARDRLQSLKKQLRRRQWLSSLVFSCTYGCGIMTGLLLLLALIMETSGIKGGVVLFGCLSVLFLGVTRSVVEMKQEIFKKVQTQKGYVQRLEKKLWQEPEEEDTPQRGLRETA